NVYAPFSWIGHRIGELEVAASVRVAYLTRLGTGLIAKPDTVIQEGDYLNLFMLEATADASHAALDAGPEKD
ncbi:MAG: TrkA family potassium uptake protein, partial [Aeromicrobium sp.]